MAVKFSQKFGLESDRVKLTAGIKNFDIVRVEIKESKKDYKTADGDAKIKIAHIDAVDKDSGKKLKFYSPNGPIVQSCKDMLESIGTDKSGALKESVFIEAVAEGGEKGREYLFFQ